MSEELTQAWADCDLHKAYRDEAEADAERFRRERDAAIDIAVECFATISPLHLNEARAKVLDDIAKRIGGIG